MHTLHTAQQSCSQYSFGQLLVYYTNAAIFTPTLFTYHNITSSAWNHLFSFLEEYCSLEIGLNILYLSLSILRQYFYRFLSQILLTATIAYNHTPSISLTFLSTRSSFAYLNSRAGAFSGSRR